MDLRINAGYIITDSIHVGNTEFVLGVSEQAKAQFVTWECKDGKNYFFGHYHSDLLVAIKDLLERAGQELEYQMNRQEQMKNHHRDKEREER